MIESVAAKGIYFFEGGICALKKKLSCKQLNRVTTLDRNMAKVYFKSPLCNRTSVLFLAEVGQFH